MDFEEKLAAVEPFQPRTDFATYVPTHGVSLNLLQSLGDTAQLNTMEDLETYVINLTARHHCSFAELLLQHPAYCGAVVPTAEYFVSFAYKTKFATFVDALENFRRKIEKEDITVWISILSVNQHFARGDGEAAPVQYPPSWFKNAFETSIGRINRVLFVLTPITDPLALKRLWCIYELYLAVRSKHCTLEICLSTEDQLRFVHGIMKDTNSILKYIQAIDSKSAGAHPDKEKNLRARIEEIPGKYYTLDNAVRNKLRNWFAYAAQAYIQARGKPTRDEMEGYIELLKVVSKLFIEMRNDKEAEPLCYQALERCLEFYGNEHVRTAEAINNLAELYQKRGEYADALPLYERALEIATNVHGEKHLVVATILNNTAQVMQALGKLAEAEAFARRALDIDMELLRDDHPSLARDMNNLARIMQDQGKLNNEVDELMRGALEILLLQPYGKEHPDVAASLINLGCLLKDQVSAKKFPQRESQEKLKQAEDYLLEGIKIDVKISGESNLNVAYGLNALGLLKEVQGDTKAAEILLRRSLAILRNVARSAKPLLVVALVNLAGFLKAKGKIGEAARLEVEATVIKSQMQEQLVH